MSSASVPLNCALACACATAYGINPVNGDYVPVAPFSPIYSPGNNIC